MKFEGRRRGGGGEVLINTKLVFEEVIIGSFEIELRRQRVSGGVHNVDNVCTHPFVDLRRSSRFRRISSIVDHQDELAKEAVGYLVRFLRFSFLVCDLWSLSWFGSDAGFYFLVHACMHVRSMCHSSAA